MSSRVLTRQTCLKRGCILTCYVNGRKRFRAIGLDESAAVGHGAAAGNLLPQAGQAQRPADGAH